MYLRPVMGSIMRGHTDEGFYARVDYELLAPSDAPTTLPALDGLSVRTREVSTDDDVAERLSGWFMALTSE
ncbi:hypothetical protein IAR55_005479 [Kwoniella newhampshirensis]|uniref:Uncharacterized protein n=1 Tax=Kwoniella newhampshirensis TaxID=1651941 RepID=A0AAW0YHJ9_9TREE